MNYSGYMVAATAIALAFGVAGCGSTGSSSPSGSSTGSQAAASKDIIGKYTVTEADGTTDIDSAQKSTAGDGGIAGFGVATAGATSAVQTAGTYVLGNVQKIGDYTLKIKVGGQEYTLTGGTAGTTGQNGWAYTAYGNTSRSSAPGERNGAFLLNTENASLAMFTKGGDAWEEVGVEDDEWTIPNMEGYGMIVTGLQTPKENLPTETAKYKGEYYYAAVASDGTSDSIGTFGASGSFDMTADFGTNKLTGYARVIGGGGAPDDHDHTEFNGTIDGNQFYGTTKRLTDVGMNGQFAGGFYGTNAQEIAGVGYGKAQPEQLGQEVDASMAFIGKKQP
jgi:hypothetical protein